MMTTVLKRVTWVHHLATGAATAGCGALALFGLIGEPDRPERFDAKQVAIAPSGEQGLRIREVIDQDFGSTERRGHERRIPTDFGVPTDVSASSPDAPDDVSVVPLGNEVRIRIGDPDTTITGQHRYVLEYTLPEARIDTGRLALDVIGTEETFETGRFEVVVVGLELEDPQCNVGGPGASGGCELARDGDAYRAVIQPLEPGEGITIGGRIVGRTDTPMPPVPPIPERRGPTSRLPLAVGLIPLGLATAAGTYLWSARRGRNEVYAGGAADAAFGGLPAPGAAGRATRRDDAPVTLVSDRRLADLATVEFAPPVGLEPWEGAVLLRELVDDHAVVAWFSGLAAREAITLEEVNGDLTIAWGPKRADLDPAVDRLLAKVVPDEGRYTVAKYDKKFASLWKQVRKRQARHIGRSGWWKRQPPTSRTVGTSSLATLVVVLVVFGGAGGGLLVSTGIVSSPLMAALFTVVVLGVIGTLVYEVLTPARSASGSALALRTESFRRFLEASEGQHVQWAWERGVLREYSAWAVALGAAEAWSRALAASDVPDDVARAWTAPILVHSMRSSLTSASRPPSSSSGSSGGFSGGSVGGGGGGGSSGSW